jgi:hypothetical protein
MKGLNIFTPSPLDAALPHLEPSYPEKLVAILTRPDLPDIVPTQWIAQQLQTPWRRISMHVMASPKVLKVMAEFGSAYRPYSGCKARSVLERKAKPDVSRCRKASGERPLATAA